MTRKLVVIGFVAVLVLAGLSAVSGGAADGTATADLEDQIRDQTDATADAMTLADDPWVPRTAGLGAGLAVGLLGGGVLAYAIRRDDG